MTSVQTHLFECISLRFETRFLTTIKSALLAKYFRGYVSLNFYVRFLVRIRHDISTKKI